MVSRAVQKKKARKETKRLRAAQAPSSSQKRQVYYNGNEAAHVSPPRRWQRTEESDSSRHPYAAEEPTDHHRQSHSDVTIVPPQYQVPPPQKRERKAARMVAALSTAAETASSVDPPSGEGLDNAKDENLSRKERKKLQAKLRLERQMARMQENAARAAASASPALPPTGGKGGEEEEGGDATAESAPAEADDPISSEGAVVENGPKLRHDPRFTNGTFWRDRKERRARTLFLGGVPARFTVQHVKDYVSTVVETDPGAVDYIAQLPPGTALVEDVDMLPDKHGSKIRHMYITMASVPIAFIASTKLDGVRMEQRTLRCNFAADKSQRSEAIKRRGPGSAGAHGGGPRGRGGRAGGFGHGGARGRGGGGGVGGLYGRGGPRTGSDSPAA